ncbi:hypothetical protein [Vibrio mimicus]|uniref:hypothetical protein n=1 Tax=Vibrio mimicus TaxID=674 RepID=UPI00076B4D20|nr:hypothetical protein [Vibrio mimicus]AMG03023.1 hypothetical protein AL543_08155 [Vibrio mimicus]KAA3492326.1 hypothetical protein Y058_10745 [Vibrio mimicus]
MTTKFLYRGFNSETSKQQALIPKNPNGSMEAEAECGDERVQCGDIDFSCGSSIGNAIHSHEYAQKGEPSGYLSFTPHFERAKYYALGGGVFMEGTVVKVSIQSLRDINFQVFSVNEIVEQPACIEDEEHSVYLGGRHFPESTIIEEIKVYRD